MAAGTGIEWTEVTWNPTTGCDRISAGCDHCYALTLAKRLKAMGQAKYQNDGDPRTSGPGFGLTIHPDALRQPYTWAGHRVVFVNSMSDLFHARVPLELRPPGLRRDRRHPAAHLPGADQALVAPAEDRRQAGLAAEPVDGRVGRGRDTLFRVDHLRAVPAAVRFLSCEPLLGPLDGLDLAGIDWVIAGGESGPDHRPLDPAWVTAIRDCCVERGSAVLLQAVGRPDAEGRRPRARRPVLGPDAHQRGASCKLGPRPTTRSRSREAFW